MDLYRIDAGIARHVTDYGSSFRLIRLLHAHEGEVRVDVVYLRPSEAIAPHPAGLPQLFCVVQGDGWVQIDEADKVPITAGLAAFWRPGEHHAAGTAVGLTALVLQADALDPASWLPPV